jgi:hypothetical protein
MTRLPRSKTNPFRVLCLALFGRHDWISRYNNGHEVHVSLQLGPLGRALRIPSERLRDYLEWLHERGYARELDLQRGRARLIVRIPDTFNWAVESEEPAG